MSTWVTIKRIQSLSPEVKGLSREVVLRDVIQFLSLTWRMDSNEIFKTIFSG